LLTKKISLSLSRISRAPVLKLQSSPTYFFLRPNRPISISGLTGKLCAQSVIRTNLGG